MGAWGLGRDGALLDASAGPPEAPRAQAPDRDVRARKAPPREEPHGGEQTMGDLAGKVLAWIPGEVIVIYGALVTLFIGADSQSLAVSPAIVLTALGVVLAGGLVVLAAWSSTSGVGWLTKRIKGRAALASIAFVIWSLTVPDSGWQEIGWIADHPAQIAAVAGVIGLIFSLIATGADNRWAKESA